MFDSECGHGTGDLVLIFGHGTGGLILIFGHGTGGLGRVDRMKGVRVGVAIAYGDQQQSF